MKPSNDSRTRLVNEAGDRFSASQQRRLSRFFKEYYVLSGRSFPWREQSVNPFQLLLAELLLRQTNAERVVNAWEVLSRAYPTPSEVLLAPEQTLANVLQPLGFVKQRHSALVSCCIDLERRFGGEVPSDIAALQTLPHVGLYISHAVACFGFGKRVPIVDQNILRLFSRLRGVELGSDNRRSPAAWMLAWQLLPSRDYREHNYGLIDFCADVCSRRAPNHLSCEISSICEFNLNKTVV